MQVSKAVISFSQGSKVWAHIPPVCSSLGEFFKTKANFETCEVRLLALCQRYHNYNISGKAIDTHRHQHLVGSVHISAFDVPPRISAFCASKSGSRRTLKQHQLGAEVGKCFLHLGKSFGTPIIRNIFFLPPSFLPGSSLSKFKRCM